MVFVDGYNCQSDYRVFLCSLFGLHRVRICPTTSNEVMTFFAPRLRKRCFKACPAGRPCSCRNFSKFRTVIETKKGDSETEHKVMSWSIGFIGTPDKIVEALNAHSEKLDGYSKTEYDKALPNMVNLVQQNFGQINQVLEVMGNGHGYIENGEPKYGSCSFSVKIIPGVIV